jgi:NADH-quinone oxidoreductase subunit H
MIVQWFQGWAGPYLGWFLANLMFVLLIALPVMLVMALSTWMDRKVWAAMQLRRGPNVVGPVGILQPFADGLKLFLKETIVPTGANKGVFFIAPMITFILALVAWAVIPFDAGWVLADINVGLLFLFAVSSLGVYGIVMSGWASNSKYPFLGGLRSAAQMISYEVSLGLIIIGVIISTGAMNFGAIVAAQDGDWGLFNW